ncbi:MAG: hypothetical protein NTZ48_07465, partial [Candidatus Omnitrophica bacterium]|nr:hypothetical protein [Candidatus Omnitrophota bacterium]
AVGNRTQMVNNSITTNYSYDAMNKMLSAGDATFTYDDNGNMLTKTVGSSTTTFEWDNEDRLTKVTLPDETEVAYEYDGVGRMISRTVNDVKRTFHHQGIDAIAEVLPSGEVKARYTMAGGVVSLHNADTPHFFHSNAIGTIETVTDANGNVEATYEMDAYGNLINSTGTLDNDFRFVGAYGVRYDATTGLYYMRARWYDAEAGRFVSRDPLETGENSYAYAYNNAHSYIDPLGLKPYLFYWKDDKPHKPLHASSPIQFGKNDKNDHVLNGVEQRRIAGLTQVSGPDEVRANCGNDAMRPLTGVDGYLGLDVAPHIASFYGHPVSRDSLRSGDLVFFTGHVGTVWGRNNDGEVIVGGADGYYGTYYGTI